MLNRLEANRAELSAGARRREQSDIGSVAPHRFGQTHRKLWWSEVDQREPCELVAQYEPAWVPNQEMTARTQYPERFCQRQPAGFTSHQVTQTVIHHDHVEGAFGKLERLHLALLQRYVQPSACRHLTSDLQPRRVDVNPGNTRAMRSKKRRQRAEAAAGIEKVQPVQRGKTGLVEEQLEHWTRSTRDVARVRLDRVQPGGIRKPLARTSVVLDDRRAQGASDVVERIVDRPRAPHTAAPRLHHAR
jgi:hypothetical protein